MSTILNFLKKKSKRRLILSILIFVSISPLFENTSKLFISSILSLILISKNSSKIPFLQVNIFLTAIFFFVLIPLAIINDFIYSRDFDFITLGFFISILIGLILSCEYSTEDFLKVNENLIHFSLILGLPIFILSKIEPGILEYAYNYSFGGFNHKSFLVANFHYDGDRLFNERFVGIAREPGLTQVFINLALWFNLKKEKRFTAKTYLLITAIVLTKSTAGLICMIFILIQYLKSRKSLKFIILSFPLFAILLFSQITYHWNNKLLGSKSFSIRYDRYLDFFSDNFYNIFFGYGNIYYSNIIVPQNLGGFDSFLQTSQRYGVLFFVLLILILSSINKKERIITIIISIGLFSQLIWFYPIISFFYFKRYKDQ